MSGASTAPAVHHEQAGLPAPSAGSIANNYAWSWIRTAEYVPPAHTWVVVYFENLWDNGADGFFDIARRADPIPDGPPTGWWYRRNGVEMLPPKFWARLPGSNGGGK